MKLMTSPTIETVDLLDLKLLPAWVKEPAEARSYAHYSGEGDTGRRGTMFGSVPTASRAAGFVSRCLAMWSVCLACLTLDVGRLLALYRSSAFWFTALRTVPRFSPSGVSFS